jgi:hypothetical protein
MFYLCDVEDENGYSEQIRPSFVFWLPCDLCDILMFSEESHTLKNQWIKPSHLDFCKIIINIILGRSVGKINIRVELEVWDSVQPFILPVCKATKPGDCKAEMLTLLTRIGFVSFLSYIWIPEEPGHTSDQKKSSW